MQYRGTDKSLARPGRKQARKHIRDARDFNNIETRAVIKFFFLARQDAEGNSHHSDRNIGFFSFLVGLKTYQHHCTYEYGILVDNTDRIVNKLGKRKSKSIINNNPQRSLHHCYLVKRNETAAS